MRSFYEERYGKNLHFRRHDDTGLGLSPTRSTSRYYDRFEYTAGVSGKAGNLRGSVQAGGNPFEGPRAREYPLPPLKSSLRLRPVRKTAAKENGYHPFPRPTANASRAYTNPDGAHLGACRSCGFCERYGCEANAKGSPHITVIPIAMRQPTFELRMHSWVTKVCGSPAQNGSPAVSYTNVLTGEEYEQPAGMVALCAYAINNVHLMLLSGIGEPYDPATQKGVIGKNYCYQTGAATTLFFEGRHFNPFMSTGGLSIVADDYNVNVDFDRGPHGFIGGFSLSGGMTTDGRSAIGRSPRVRRSGARNGKPPWRSGTAPR